MEFKAARASLAAILAATLAITLLPTTFAQSGSQTQQDAAARPRRGKNGGTVSRSADRQSARPADQTGTPPSGNTEPASAQGGGQDLSATRDATSAQGTSPLDGDSSARASSEQREAPPFDRPPLNRTQGDTSGGSASRPGGSTANRGPDYAGGRSSRQPQTSTSRGADSNTDSSSGGDADDARTSRSSGAPPVLQRPSDSRRPAGDVDGGRSTRSDGGPPVLQRRSDSGSPQRSESDQGAGRPSSSGQQQPAGDDEVIKLESTLVNIPLLVSDRSGRYIPQLSARDFALYEDGVRQTIASFGSEEVPFSVVLLLDVSPSVQGSIEDIQDAAIEFVRQLRAQDRIMVASFDRSIHYMSDFTNDRRELEYAIRKIGTGSGTSVYDAVYESVARRLKNVEGRKALILFSDGEDTTSSRASYDDAVDLVSESDVLVYGLRYPGNGGGARRDPWPRSPIPGIQLPFPLPFPWPMPRRRRGPFRFSADPSSNSAAATASPQSWPRRRGGGDFMEDITAAGGGPVYDAEKLSDLSRVAARIAEELRHVYVISYYPTNALSNGGYRRVRVSVTARDNIAVRHRPGYNARPNTSAKPTT